MSLDQARTYLQRVLPWPPLGDPNAYFNIHYPTNRLKQDGTPFWGGRACQSIDEMLKVVADTQKWNGAKGDIYVCLSSQRMAEPKTVNGYSFVQAVRSTGSAVHLKSLFIDIDVKPDQPEKAYLTPTDAALGLKDFLTQSGLPGPTLVVRSGTGGMHVYWVLDRVLTREEWQPLANALANAARQFGLKFDSNCTVDAARILRVPGTYNFKQSPPLPVELVPAIQPLDHAVDAIRQALMPYTVAVAKPALTLVGPAPAGAMGQMSDELGGGIEGRQARPVVLPSVIPRCGFIAEAYHTGGEHFDQSLWNLATLAATFAEDGRAQAHAMAKGHPDYKPEDTDALYDRKEQERADKNIGWPSCQSIQNAGCKACATCPAARLGGSPLGFAQRAAVAPPPGAARDLPAGYHRDAAGRVVRQIPGADGTVELIPVYDAALTDGWVQDDPWTLHFDTRLGNRTRSISIEAEALQTRDWAKLLARQGMDANKHQITLLQEFLVSWLKELKAQNTAVVSAHPFGWVLDGNKLAGFSYGGTLWMPGDSKPTATPDHVIAKQYGPKGDIEPWKEAAKMITDQNRPALDTILAMSFGSPLMRFTGESGLLLSAYSPESGIGKSTAIKIGQAVWGDPIRGVQSLSDTTNSVIKKMGELRALPMYWDELKTEHETNRFITLAFQLTQGKEKSRLDASTAQRDPGLWQTMLLAASNDSLLDFVMRQTKSTTAGAYRVFEYVVPPALVPSMAHGAAARLVAATQDNFGQAGLVYARFLGENFVDVEKKVAELQDALSSKLSARPDERFWIAGMTCCLMGALYANKLGLTSFNIPALQKFLIAQLGNMRSELTTQPVDLTRSASIEQILAQYLGQHRARHTLVTDRVHQGRGKPATGSVKVVNDVTRLEAVYIHIGERDALMRLSCAHFRDWLQDHGYSPYNTAEAMRKQWGVTRVNGRMGAGTNYATAANEYLYEIDMRKAGLISEEEK